MSPSIIPQELDLRLRKWPLLPIIDGGPEILIDNFQFIVVDPELAPYVLVKKFGIWYRLHRGSVDLEPPKMGGSNRVFLKGGIIYNRFKPTQT